MNCTAQGLVDFARSKIGVPYFYGSKGAVLTTSYFNSMRSMYPDVTYSWESNKIGVACCDCSGLISWYTDIMRGSLQYKESADDVVSIGTVWGDWDKYKGYGLWLSGHIGIVSDTYGYYIAEDGSDSGCVERPMSHQNWVYALKLCDIDYAVNVSVNYHVANDSTSFYDGYDNTAHSMGVAYRGQVFSGYPYNNNFTKSVDGAGAGYWFETSVLKEGAYTVWDGKGTEYAGTNRYETAAAITRAAFKSAKTGILVSGENFPDAIAATGFAGSQNAPLLLTTSSSLPQVTANLIAELGIKEIVIAGGTGPVSEAVESAVKNLVPNVVRVAGGDRVVTAQAVNQYGKGDAAGWDPKVAILTTGNNFPDAIAISPYAYQGAFPILFTNGATLEDKTKEALIAIGTVLIVGGTGAVPSAIELELVNAGVSVTRISGLTRYDTATAIVIKYATDWSCIAIASGNNFPDALVGGTLCGQHGYPLLLVDNDAGPKVVLDVIKAHASVIKEVIWLGGLGAVNSATRQKILNQLSV